LKIYGISEKHFDKMCSLLEKHFSKLGKDCKVYLYGSRSNGTYKDFSDVDLFVENSNKRDISKNILNFKSDWEESNIPYKLDIVEFDKLFEPYKKQILKDKKLIWNSDSKKHSLRICVNGEHWVTRHNRLRNGKIEDVDGHCRANKSGKDVIFADEITLISNSEKFQNLDKENNLSIKVPGLINKKYDTMIIGWTAYWNEALSPKEKLDPVIVKALVFSESTFNENVTVKAKGNNGYARGLMQVTDRTLKLLREDGKELKNHFVDLKQSDMLVPERNICAGIRWLFRKKELLEKKLKREVSWVEAVFEYKGITRQVKNKTSIEIKNNFLKIIKE